MAARRARGAMALGAVTSLIAAGRVYTPPGCSRVSRPPRDDGPVAQHDVVSASFPAATRRAIISVILPAITVLQGGLQ
jgi:hypothetical protein